MTSNWKSRSMTFAILLLGSVAMAHASPAAGLPKCDVEEPPPACSPEPRPVPTAPPTLSRSITLDPRFHNEINVDVSTLSLDPHRSDGDPTEFSVYLTCSDSYQRFGPMIYGVFHAPHWGALLRWTTEVPPNSTSDNCTVATYDQRELHVTRSIAVLRIDGTTATTAKWYIKFE
ncbi:hypothetical protein [Herbiconiux flava]|uniref:Uncharacterized protein n=1 Tax=Herbiconiux flava TaxID=881268 RepID=A0A852SL09_9MICO|nr:hypothetical protein [Herbiconiux flava]NYD69915.1 hypothetical protein [Herbiconiux flava]GLK16664.1 hypothetical protein GCM10017602_11460 [Herbiconiux flava]